MTPRTTLEMISSFVLSVPGKIKSYEFDYNHDERNIVIPVPLCSMITPIYTVTNCLGRDRKAARAKTKIPIPHAENTAVVTSKNN